MSTATERPVPSITIEPPDLYEVVDGQIVEKPATCAFESEIASILLGFLAPFVRAQRRGRAVSEMLFRIDPVRGLERRPDLAFVSHKRWPLGRSAPMDAAWDVVPDLAVEIISPSNSAYDVEAKLDEYFRAGVRAVWIVFPRSGVVYVHDSRTAVRVCRSEAGDELDGGPVLPGFRLPLTTLFGRNAAPVQPE